MSKINFKQVFKDVRRVASKHSPEILIGIGITGMFTSAVWAVKETPKAMKLIEEAKELKQEYSGEDAELTKTEVVKAAWKPYVGPAVTMIASASCIIVGTGENLKRNAAWATMYQVATTTAREFEEKTVEVVGEETVKEIREKIVQEKEHTQDNKKESQSSSSTHHHHYYNDREALIYEPTSNQYFKSSKDKIKAVVVDLNGKMVDGVEYCISLNEFLQELGIKTCPIGDDVGWHESRRIDLTFADSHTDDDMPCFDIVYLTLPYHNYMNPYK